MRDRGGEGEMGGEGREGEMGGGKGELGGGGGREIEERRASEGYRERWRESEREKITKYNRRTLNRKNLPGTL